jgi:multidrug efflux pump subunit AcrA (membrane-fusion protein)
MFLRVMSIVVLAGCAAACSKSEMAQARGREDAAKPVKVERVKQESIHRSVEVVGTLAAVDEVTVSS